MVGGADGSLHARVGAVAAFGGSRLDARRDETAGALEVAHEIDGLIVRAKDADLHVDIALLGALRLDGCDLDAGGEDGFHGFHGEGPGEGFFVEALVEEFGLLEEFGVLGLLHEGLGGLALGLNAGDLAVERVLESAGFGGLAVEEMQADKRRAARARRGCPYRCADA